MDKICINKLVAVGLILVIILLIVYQYVSNESRISELKKNNQQNVQCNCPSCTKSTHISDNVYKDTDIDNQNHNKNIIIDVNQPSLAPPIQPSLMDIARDYDYRTFADPLVPPYKRDDYQIPLPSMPTRGYPSSFKKMGTLIDEDAPNDDPYKFMILVGRQKYPGSNWYDYYVTENRTDSPLKFDIQNIHKEFMSDDELKVKELKKTYKINIDRNLGFDYNPFVL